MDDGRPPAKKARLASPDSGNKDNQGDEIMNPAHGDTTDQGNLNKGDATMNQEPKADIKAWRYIDKKFQEESMPQTPLEAQITLSKTGTTYILPITELARYSKYFRAALTGNFLEAYTKVMKIGNISDASFQAVVEWIYDDPEPRHDVKTKNLNMVHLTEMYIFSEYTQMPGLQNAVSDSIEQAIQNYHADMGDDFIDAVSLLWRKNKVNSAPLLKEFLLATYGHPVVAIVDWRTEEMPAAFLRDYAEVAIDRQERFSSLTGRALSYVYCDVQYHMGEREGEVSEKRRELNAEGRTLYYSTDSDYDEMESSPEPDKVRVPWSLIKGDIEQFESAIKDIGLCHHTGSYDLLTPQVERVRDPTKKVTEEEIRQAVLEINLEDDAPEDESENEFENDSEGGSEDF